MGRLLGAFSQYVFGLYYCTRKRTSWALKIELMTMLSKVEAIINSFPLTFLHSPSDEGTALTLSHFLTGKRFLALRGSHPNIPATTKEMMRRWKHWQRILDSFWHWWRNQHFLQLRSAHHSASENNALKQGNLNLWRKTSRASREEMGKEMLFTRFSPVETGKLPSLHSPAARQ